MVESYSALYEDYLTDTAGRELSDTKCQGPVRFSLYPLVQKEPSIFLSPQVLEKGVLDFIASPQLTMSCWAWEYEVRRLAQKP
jgi:hypothetical protein